MQAGVSALFDNVNFVDVGGDGGAVGLDETTVTPAGDFGGFRGAGRQARGSFAGRQRADHLAGDHTTGAGLAPARSTRWNSDYATTRPFGTSTSSITWMKTFSPSMTTSCSPPAPPDRRTSRRSRWTGRNASVSARAASTPRTFHDSRTQPGSDGPRTGSPSCEAAIRGAGTTFTPAGNIDTPTSRPSTDLSLGQVFGPS